MTAAFQPLSSSDVHLRRSFLFVPGSNEKALKKAATLDFDAIIIDLEDAVAPESKDAARQAALDFLETGVEGRETLVRINGPDSPWYDDDIAAFSNACVHGLLIPKVETAETIYAVDEAMHTAGAPDTMGVWAMIETPLGVLHCDDIAASSSRLQGFMLGLEDLSRGLGAERDSKRSQVEYALQRVVMAARAYGLSPIDSPCTQFKDEGKQAKAEAEQARALGYEGKCCIHPSQLDAVNDCFAPSSTDIKEAKRVIEAFEKAREKGEGIATLDGRLIESMHVDSAVQCALTARKLKERSSK